MNILIKSKYITWINIVVIIVTSWIAYFAFLGYIHYSTMFNSCATMVVAFNSVLLYLNLLIVVGFTSIFDFALYSGYMNFNRIILTTLQKERKLKGNLNNPYLIPKFLQRYINLFKKLIG